jgi:assimilatory nitrate reductase catalytic subunit
MATNPAVSLPDADAARDALRQLDLLVVSENVLANDTVSRGAHVFLPAAAWGEKDGTVTNSERRISRQRAFLPLPGEAKPDWWIVAEVAKRLGFAQAFAFGSAAEIFREHAALSAFENDGSRDFDLSGLINFTDDEYEALTPEQWPLPRPSPSRGGVGVGNAGIRRGRPRFFADGRFFTPDGKARFIAPERPAAAALSHVFPFTLNTGRVRDQWHSMTRTGKSARLGSHKLAPFVEVHPADAARLDLRAGDLARVSTAHGSALLEVIVEEGQRPGSLFAPIHWSAETSSGARVGALVQPIVDPISGQPDAKATPASIAPEPMAMRGFVLSRGALGLPAAGGCWWARVAIEGGFGTLFATNLTTREFADWPAALFPGAELAEYVDDAAGVYRCAATTGGSLEAVLFAGPAEARPQWDAVRAPFAESAIEPASRKLALSGHAPDGRASAGPLVCACFGVGLAAIRDAVVADAATSPEAIGALLRAGTNCGSCVPELKRIIARELAPQAG